MVVSVSFEVSATLFDADVNEPSFVPKCTIFRIRDGESSSSTLIPNAFD